MGIAAATAGVELHVYPSYESSGSEPGQWIQDRFEAGYLSMPKTDGGQQVIRVYVLNDSRPNESEYFGRFERGPGTAVVMVGNGDDTNEDMGGNFEVVPPTPFILWAGSSAARVPNRIPRWQSS